MNEINTGVDWRLRRADELREQADRHQEQAKGYTAVISGFSGLALTGVLILGVGAKHNNTPAEIAGALGAGWTIPAAMYVLRRRQQDQLAQEYRNRANELEGIVITEAQAATVGLVSLGQLKDLVDRRVAELQAGQEPALPAPPEPPALPPGS